MENYSDQLNINFTLFLKILWYRKKYILLIFLFCIITAILLRVTTPNKYISTARLMFNNAQSTNLSNINPFAIAEAEVQGPQSMRAVMTGAGSNTTTNEIDFIKSPIVLDKVIQKHHIIYEDGLKQGELMNTEDFLETGTVKIDMADNPAIVEISYKSESPVFSRDVVVSIIESYKLELEKRNVTKAQQDKNFLQKELIAAQKKLDDLSGQLRQYKESTGYGKINLILSSNSLSTLINKNLTNEIDKLPSVQKQISDLQLKLELASSKYKMLSDKYEWAKLVENMSGNSINYTIIKQPEIKRPFEKSEPSLTKNLIIAIIMATILGLISVILIEMIDKNITFLSTGIYKTLFIGSIVNQTDLQCFALHLKTFLDTDPTSIGTRFLALDLDQQDLQKLDTKTNGLITESVIMNYQSASNRFQDIITNIQSGIPLVLIGKINLTNKKLFQEIEALTLKHKNLLYKVIVI